jgi:hypothetical protein
MSCLHRHQALLFVPLTIAILGFGVVAVHGRMTTQRKCREWLTEHQVARLLAHGHRRTRQGSDRARDQEIYGRMILDSAANPPAAHVRQRRF